MIWQTVFILWTCESFAILATYGGPMETPSFEIENDHVTRRVKMNMLVVWLQIELLIPV